MSDDDIEALARHNGLCSNLLDWTISPYIAAFFAFTVALDLSNDGRLTAGTLNLSAICLPIEPVAIWRLGARPDLWVGGEFELLSDLTAVNRWQKSQDGVFTRLRHNEFACAAEYLESIGKGDALTCFEVPGGGALSALDELNDMRINFANLFPDLRGAALQANLVSALKLA